MPRRPTDSPILQLASDVGDLASGVSAAREAQILGGLETQLPRFANVLDLPPAVAQLRRLERALAAHDVRTIVDAPIDTWHTRLALWERVHAAHRMLVRMLDGDGYALLTVDDDARELYVTLGLLRRAERQHGELVRLARALASDDFRTPTDAQRARRAALAEAHRADPSKPIDDRSVLALGDHMAEPLHAVRDALREVLAIAVDDETRALGTLRALVERLEAAKAPPIVFRHLTDWLDHALPWARAHGDAIEDMRFAVRRRDGSPRSAAFEQRDHLFRLRAAARRRGDLEAAIAITDQLLQLEPAGTTAHYEHQLVRLELSGASTEVDLLALLDRLESMPASLPRRTQLLVHGLWLLRGIAQARGDAEAELRAARRAFLLPLPRVEDHDARGMRVDRHADLAALLVRVGRFDEARHHLERASEATPRGDLERRVDLLAERARLERAAGDSIAEDAVRREIERTIDGAEPSARAALRRRVSE
ncbi:MAG: hypothetical protein J0L92_17205 [Deltaproteobacteria bacterium]|nr:hypothetical protein [Deltaproteobacteria bacterium]